MSVLQSIHSNYANLIGIKANGKIVVFESDDWGSVRVPSKSAYTKLKKLNIPVDTFHYDSLDCLENENDLVCLFDVLSSVKDSHSKSAKFTFNTIVANPDFEQIRKDNFSGYSYQSFDDTYKQYWGKSLLPIWKEAMVKEYMVPQFHGREHVNVSLWMQLLASNNKQARVGFDLSYLGYTGPTGYPNHKHFLSAFHILNSNDLENKRIVFSDGLKLFKSLFGFSPASFIACNYTWPSSLEKDFSKEGIRLIQGQRAQFDPVGENGEIEIKRHYTGQKNENGQTFLVRNCFFEPASDPNYDWVSSCLKQISNAFFWNTPAIISSHRVNYVGSLMERNRTENVKMLKALLNQILKRWPDVQFLTTQEMGKHIY